MIFFKKLYNLLSPSHRKHLILLSFLVLLSGIMEIAGIASIMPFMGMVVDPGIVSHNHWLSLLYQHFKISSPEHFLIFLGFIVLGIIFLSNIISALTIWNILRFSLNMGRDLSQTMFSAYLNHPYVFFLSRNTSDLIQNILFEVGRIVNGILIPLLTIFSRSVITLSILTLLIWMNPMLAFVSGTVLGGAYALVFLLARQTLGATGKEMSRENARRNQVAYETFGGIKDIKILGREREFFDRFRKPVERYSSYQAKSQMISLLPRYALETIAFGGIIVIVIYLLSAGGTLAHALPLISLYALAGYRLMPALQQIFANLTTIRFNASSIDRISDDLISLRFDPKSTTFSVPPPVENPMKFTESIRLDRIRFHYPNREEAVLQDLSLSIPARRSIGIVGSTGSGKTTTLDILLGLLSPTSGVLRIDGVPVDEGNLRSWQANIGYVPQQIMLMDDTILHNIAFGIPEEKIDRSKVIRAAQLAHLHSFVETELPNGYDTEIGERGIRLSGGQRQRIGIARALYHEPSVLVLDEATSALDNITENVIMEALNTLSRQKTIIMVAHRLTTVRECDTIVVMDRGTISDQGTYQELLERNDFFSTLVQEPARDSSEVVTD
ncbi:MAG: ABC transporter ATP-binding protein [Leptospirales bacterium]